MTRFRFFPPASGVDATVLGTDDCLLSSIFCSIWEIQIKNKRGPSLFFYLRRDIYDWYLINQCNQKQSSLRGPLFYFWRILFFKKMVTEVTQEE